MLCQFQFCCCLGSNIVEQPFNLRTRLGDSSFMYSWEHQNEIIVDYYQLDLEWEQDGCRNQTILVTDTSVVFNCIPGVSYNATVRAVTVCPGIMSAPTSFQGKSHVRVRLRVLLTPFLGRFYRNLHTVERVIGIIAGLWGPKIKIRVRKITCYGHFNYHFSVQLICSEVIQDTIHLHMAL